MSRASRISLLVLPGIALCAALAGCGDTSSSQAALVDRKDRAVRLASETTRLELRDWPAQPAVDPA